MKICHITCVHNAFDGRIFHKMAVSAAENGFEVSLIAPHDKIENVQGVKIYPIKKSRYRLKRFLDTFRVKKLLALIDADVYHFHDPELIPLMKKFKNKNSNKKIIYDIHEYYKEVILSKKWIPKVFRKLISEYVWKRETDACKIFDLTIAATEELADIYKPYSKKNSFILNYDFKKTINLCEKYDGDLKDIDVIHVGTISEERFRFLYEVFLNLYNDNIFLNWYFIGVTNGLIEKYNRIISKEQKEYIHFIGRIPFEDVKKYYIRTKIGINYHPFEKRFLIAIPMKIFEYMKYGLAVITTNLPTLKKYLKNGNNGEIVEDNTVNGFSRAIRKLIKEGNFEEISIYNKKIIFEKYNWETESEKLLKLYTEMGEK